MSSKELDLSTDLVPIGKFRSGTAKLLEQMNADGRTLVITQNGEAAAVVCVRVVGTMGDRFGRAGDEVLRAVVQAVDAQ